MDHVARVRASDEFLKRLAAALRGAQLYSPAHPLVQKAFDALNESLNALLADQPSIAVGIIGNEIIIGDMPMAKAAESLGEMIKRLKSLGIERIAFERGVTPEELQTLAMTIAHPERKPDQAAPGVEPADPLAVFSSLAHIRVGRIQTEEKKEESKADIAAIRRMYNDSTNLAGSVWDMAKSEGVPDPKAARALVDSLAQAVQSNRTALIALTALKSYDK